jgi:hypothetical protein
MINISPDNRAYLENMDGFKILLAPLVKEGKRLGRMWSR